VSRCLPRDACLPPSPPPPPAWRPVCRARQHGKSDYKKLCCDYLGRAPWPLSWPPPGRGPSTCRASPWRPDRPRQRPMEPYSCSEFRELRPSARRMAAGADPPVSTSWPLRRTHHSARLPGAHGARRRSGPTPSAAAVSPRAERGPLSPCTAVTTERPDGRQLAGLCPPGDGLWVHPEHCCDLCRRQQWLSLWCACRHVYGLSSWTGTAILRFVAMPGSIGEPAVDVPYGLLRDHIAITSGDKSTTGSKVSVMTYPVAPLIWVTLRDSSDTERRNGQIRKSPSPSLNYPARSPPKHTTWRAGADTWRQLAQAPRRQGQ
jgi:hypothetical protein